MWDYNRDGKIDQQDEDDYWFDEYFEEERIREEEELNDKSDIDEYDPYQMDEDEMREVLEEAGYDSDELDDMDEDDMIDAIEDINLGIENTSFDKSLTETSGLISTPCSRVVQPAAQKTSYSKTCNSIRSGRTKSIGLGGIILGGIFVLWVFCIVFDIDLSNLSSGVMVLVLSLSCVLWYGIWKLFH